MSDHLDGQQLATLRAAFAEAVIMLENSGSGDQEPCQGWVDDVARLVQVATRYGLYNPEAIGYEPPDQTTEEEKVYDTCMTVRVDELGKGVDINLDTSRMYNGEWIEGEGGDICLYRDRETNKVIGAYLPLMVNRLSVWHTGPLRVNNGFLAKLQN